jgi:voltage-gated potassium channel
MTQIAPDGFTRRQMAETALFAGVCSTLLIAVYYTVPLLPRPHAAVWLRVTIAIAVFVAVLARELRSILRNVHPMRRAIIALSIILPLFVVMFSWVYLTMSHSDPATFGGAMSRTKALYFTVTVLSTVGFGDITPHTDPARLVTTVQMALDLALIAIVVRLIFDVASRATKARATNSD